MRKYIIFLLFLCCGYVWADNVKVHLNPQKPVAGDIFRAVFRISTDSSEEPSINFNPSNVEVIGKSNQGISTSSVYANGRLTTTREMVIVYELSASNPGSASLRDINVQLGNKNLRHPNISFQVLKEQEVLGDVFVMADVPKKEVYLGEGIVVKYYLYSKAPVSNLDVKKYPKLNHFLKRFLQEPERSERVMVDGNLYTRNQIYAAKLFPEKIGELKIDPLQLTATIMSMRGADPFGSFGLNREMKTKSISSEMVKIDVLPLPEDGKPVHFTGLVGKHEFDLQISNTKLLVNSPLELKLSVTGGGALENLEAPAMLRHRGLEEFESNGDLRIMNADMAVKSFNYTFLPKENLNLPAKIITLSYFDPDTRKYVGVDLNLPSITVAGEKLAGGGVSGAKESKIPRQAVKKDSSTPANILAGPVFDKIPEWQGWMSYFNIGLGIAAFILSFCFLIKFEKIPKLNTSSIPTTFRKGNFNFTEFTQWISPLIAKTGKTPQLLIKESDLDAEAKRYFIDLLNASDYKDYANKKKELNFVYRSKYFKALDRHIHQSVNDDSSSRPA
jgi:hypothetical protein